MHYANACGYHDQKRIDLITRGVIHCLFQLTRRNYQLPICEREFRILVNDLAQTIDEAIEERDNLTYDQINAIAQQICSLRISLNQLAN